MVKSGNSDFKCIGNQRTLGLDVANMQKVGNRLFQYYMSWGTDQVLEVSMDPLMPIISQIPLLPKSFVVKVSPPSDELARLLCTNAGVVPVPFS